MQHEVYELFAEGVSRNMKDLARKKAKFDVSKCFPTSEELSALWRQYTMYHAAVQHSYRNQQHVMHPLPVPKQFVPSSRGPLGQPQSQAPTVLNATRASDPPQVQSASQDVPLGPFGTLPEDPSDYFPLN
ncbi:uncharacterized protein JCM6883_003302 [Sporobolomyces salmoneus]|uniref:uncharacterized protein n=1 Tax=Sporobolomyces salmoneus TaxID=183962 RepID=UPI003176664B